jgi:hypothetical protein
VIENGTDGTVATGDGTVINDPNGSTTVGVRFTLLTDAVGHTHVYTPVSESHQPGNYRFNAINDPADMVQAGLSKLAEATTHFGRRRGPEGTYATAAGSGSESTGSGGECRYAGATDGELQTDNAGCACRTVNPSQTRQTVATVNPSTGTRTDSGSTSENDDKHRTSRYLGDHIPIDRATIYSFSRNGVLTKLPGAN